MCMVWCWWHSVCMGMGMDAWWVIDNHTCLTSPKSITQNFVSSAVFCMKLEGLTSLCTYPCVCNASIHVSICLHRYTTIGRGTRPVLLAERIRLRICAISSPFIRSMTIKSRFSYCPDIINWGTWGVCAKACITLPSHLSTALSKSGPWIFTATIVWSDSRTAE